MIALLIGKTYADEIWCDILPMDACHVLLGRPWLFDRRVIYDGHQNTYTFHKDSRKITLAPLAPHQIPKPKSKENPKEGEVFLSLLEATLFATHHEYRTHQEMILHIPSQEAPTEIPLHPLATPLIRTYAHVFPEELPSGLPH